MSYFDPSTNTYKDSTGTPYQTPDNKPATYGTPATSYQGGQKIEGTIRSGYFVPNN